MAICRTKLTDATAGNICQYLRNCLEELHQSCQSQEHCDADSHSAEDHTEQKIKEAAAFCIAALERTAALSACSDFVLPEALTVLQTYLHGHLDTAEQLVSLRLADLLKSPPAADLVMLSISASPERLLMFHSRLHELLVSETVSPASLRNQLLARHFIRDLRRLIPELEGSSQMMSSQNAVHLTPYLPFLVGTALRVGLDLDHPEERSQTQNSRASQSTQYDKMDPPDAAGLLLAAESSLSIQEHLSALPEFTVSILARVLDFLSEKDSIIKQLGIRLPCSPGGLPIVVFDEGEQQKVAPSVDPQTIEICQNLTEVVLNGICAHPEVGAAALAKLEGPLGGGQGHPAEPGGSSCSGDTLQKSDPLGLKSADSCARRKLERKTIDLLCLHYELLNTSESSPAEGTVNPKTACLLDIACVEWLAKIALKEMEAEQGPAQSNRRASRRVSGLSNGAAKNSVKIAPHVAAHLLKLAQSMHLSLIPEGYPFVCHGDEESITNLAEIAIGFGSVARQGPLPGVLYAPRLPSAIALQSHRHQSSGKSVEENSLSLSQETSRDPALPSSKRQKVSHNVALDGLQPDLDAMQARSTGSQPRPSRFKPQALDLVLKTDSRLKDVGTPNHKIQPGTANAVSRRRIAPTPLSKQDREEIPDSLLQQKQQDEEYWEQYIQVKEEFVEKVLQDKVEEDIAVPGSLGGGQDPFLLARKQSRAGNDKQDLIVSGAFREPPWQALQAAALGLLGSLLPSLLICSRNEDSVWEVFELEQSWWNAQQVAFTAGCVVDPHLTAGRRFNSILAGVKSQPRECCLLGLTVRLSEYCTDKLTNDLLSAFLTVLQFLMDRIIHRADLPPSVSDSDKVMRPLILAGEILEVILERPILKSEGMSLKLLQQYSQCLLCALPITKRIVYTSAALWAVVQANKGHSVRAPWWMSSMLQDWVNLWGGLSDKKDVRVACGFLLDTLFSKGIRSLLQGFHEVQPMEMGCEREIGGEVPFEVAADVRLDLHVQLANALAVYCAAIPEKGKEVITGAGLRAVLSVAVCVLKEAALTVAKLQTCLAEESVCKEVWSMTCFVRTAQNLRLKCVSVLQWREETCPQRAKNPALLLATECQNMEGLHNAFLKSLEPPANRRDSKPADAQGTEASATEIRKEVMDELLREDAIDSQNDPLPSRREEAENFARVPSKSSRQKGLWKPENAYLKAVLAEEGRREHLDSEDGEEDGYSDLEDFIVCKPERDYESLLATEFKYTAREY